MVDRGEFFRFFTIIRGNTQCQLMLKILKIRLYILRCSHGKESLPYC